LHETLFYSSTHIRGYETDTGPRLCIVEGRVCVEE